MVVVSYFGLFEVKVQIVVLIFLFSVNAFAARLEQNIVEIVLYVVVGELFEKK